MRTIELSAIVATLLLAACATEPVVAENLEPLFSCRAVDGDTLNCNGERIRIIGIDAPEKGACRPGRLCVEGDPIRATETLAAELHKPITIERMGEDRYGRTLGHVYAGDRSVACSQLAAGSAEYIRRWDDRPQGRVQEECGA